MERHFLEGFIKSAKSISLKAPSFGKSIRGSAFSDPSKPMKPNLPNFGLSGKNSSRGYKPGSSGGVKTNSY